MKYILKNRPKLSDMYPKDISKGEVEVIKRLGCRKNYGLYGLYTGRIVKIKEILG